MGLWSAAQALLGFSAVAAAAPVPPRIAERALVLAADSAESPSPRRRPVGGAGNLIAAGFIQDLDPNSELRGALWYGEPGKTGVAGWMLRDPHVRIGLNYLLNPMCSASWCFQPASKDPKDVEVAEFATWAFFDQLPWAQILRRIGISYMTAGFALEEPTDDVRPVPARFKLHPGGGKGLLPIAFHQRPAWSVYRWHQSKSNPSHLEAIEQRLMGVDGERTGFVKVPADRLLRFTWDQEGADFDGLAPLRSIYQPWRQKLMLLGFESMAHERHSLGVPVFTPPDGGAPDEDFQTAFEIGSELRAHAKSAVVLESGWKMEWKNAAAGTDLHQTIIRCNQDIAIGFGFPHMMLGQANPGGSNALAYTQSGPSHLEVDAHARFVATVLHRGSDGASYLERIIRANYGNDVEIPRPVAKYLPTKNWDAVTKSYVTAVQAGALPKYRAAANDLLAAMDLPPIPDDVEFPAAPPPALAAAGPGGKGAPDESADLDAPPVDGEPEKPDEHDGEEAAV